MKACSESFVVVDETVENDGVAINSEDKHKAADAIFGAASFTSQNGSFEGNSTFTSYHFVRDSPSPLLGEWFKRTLYEPQNRSLVGCLKLKSNDKFYISFDIINVTGGLRC